MNFDFAKVTRFAGRVGLKLKAASPEIMLGLGIVGVIGAGYLACKATLKSQAVIEETHEMIDDAEIDAVDRRLPEKYRKKAIFKVYVHQTAKMARIYAPAMAVGAASLALIIGSHSILNRRYLGVTAAYKAVEEAYRAYRKKVANMIGEEEEKDLYLGRERRDDIPVETNDPNNGDPVISATSGVVVNPKYNVSPYARFFDERSSQWEKNAEFNNIFLRSQQNYANNLLRARGHLFLNEVYDMLDIPRTQEGQVVGWVLGNGDDYVDFGLNDCYREKVRDFVNGYERSILLDFNVDGVIYDKI